MNDNYMDNNCDIAEASIEKPKRVIRRRRSRKAADGSVRADRMYFNADTQRAIVAYQTEQDKRTRDKLYINEILPAFSKLVENLINIHKFSGLHDTYDELKNDCVNFLFETIKKFDGERGTNAFSYFNVVAKNWLIIRTKQKAARIKKSVSFDDPEGLTAAETRALEEHCTIQSQDVVYEHERTAKDIMLLLHEIRGRAKSENELLCINAIITVFDNINEIDLLNKSAVLLYMRELSGLNPKQLMTTMQAIKRHYRRLKIDTDL